MAPDDTTWPLWRRRTGPGEAPSPDDVAELARYVSAEALDGFNFSVPPAGVPGRDVAEQLYEELARMRIGHLDEAARVAPVRTGTPQQIRAPRDVQRSTAATTLDACVLFANLARSAGLGPVLAIGRDLRRDDLRAIVLVLPDGDGSIGAGVRRHPGIATADGLTTARIATGSLIAVDVDAALTSAGRPEPASFDVATGRGGQFVRSMVAWGEPLHLADVRALEQLSDHRPHTPTRDDAFLPMSLPPHAGHATLFARQRSAVEALREGSGVMVLLGPAGSGKTTAALHLASERVNGPAWFLDATSPDSLVSSLAEIGVREDGRSMDQLDSLDRRGWSDAMLARANRSSSPWCVVADNADGDPALILNLLPRPSPASGQAVIVTTTNPAWLDVSTVTAALELGPLEEAEAERALSDYDDLADLVDGRVLILEAYARYLANGGKAGELRRHADEAAGDLRGVVALVGAVLETRPDLRDELGRLSLLPPDRLSRGVPDGRLATYGLVDLDPVTQAPRMHRLIARGVQRVLGDAALSRIALRMMEDTEDRDVLSVSADPELLETLTRLLLESPAAGNGPALAAAASLMELRGRIPLSWRLAAHAQSDFPGPEEELRVEYADVLQCLARYTNQQQAGDVQALEVAIGQVTLAQGISERHGDAGRLRRARRLEALLRMKRAKLETEPTQRVAGIAEALAGLERAASEAEETGDPAEAARARFNIAGPCIELAQLVPDQASEYLNHAVQVYEDVRHSRVMLYRQPLHPHVAACVAGVALVRYLQALLVDGTLFERQALLAEASQHATQALDDRFALDGPLGGADTGKSARLLTKIAYARQLLNEGYPSGDVLAEAARETALPRLTAGWGPREFIERWCGSPALGDLLGDDAADSLEATLRRARALADDGHPDDAEPRTVLVAARHLGLMDVELPTRRAFSVALVVALDGTSLRASWTALRRHLAEGRLTTDRLVIATRGDGLDHPLEGETLVLDDDAPFEHLAWLAREVAMDDDVLLVTRDLHRLHALARLRSALPAQRVEALGVRVRRPTPADYRHEIGATAAALEAWWQAWR